MKHPNKIKIYCKCEVCNNYFDVTGVKRSKYCSKSCRSKVYYLNKKSNERSIQTN